MFKSLLRIIMLFIVFLPNWLQGQTTFFLDLSGNYMLPQTQERTMPEQEPDLKDILYRSYTVTEKFEIKPGISVGGGISHRFTSRIGVSTSLGVRFYNFKRIIDYDFGQPFTRLAPDERLTESRSDFWGQDYTNNGLYQTDDDIINPPENAGDVSYIDVSGDGVLNKETVNDEQTSNVGNTKILYLSIPINVYYTIIPERLNVHLGAVNYFVITSSQITAVLPLDYFFTKDFVFEEYNNKTSFGLNNYVISANLSVECRIINNFWLSAKYEQGLTPVYQKVQQYVGNAKMKVVSAGIRYYF